MEPSLPIASQASAAVRAWRWFRGGLFDVLGGPHGRSRRRLALAAVETARPPLFGGRRARVLLPAAEVFLTTVALPGVTSRARARMAALQRTGLSPISPQSLTYAAVVTPSGATRIAMARASVLSAFDDALRDNGWRDVDFVAASDPLDGPVLVSRQGRRRRRARTLSDLAAFALAGLALVAAGQFAEKAILADVDRLRERRESVRAQAVERAQAQATLDLGARIASANTDRWSVAAVAQDLAAAIAATPEGAAWRRAEWNETALVIDVVSGDALAAVRALDAEVEGRRAALVGAVNVEADGALQSATIRFSREPQ